MRCAETTKIQTFAVVICNVGRHCDQALRALQHVQFTAPACVLQETVTACKLLLQRRTSDEKHAEQAQQHLDEIICFAGQVADPSDYIAYAHAYVPACTVSCRQSDLELAADKTTSN